MRVGDLRKKFVLLVAASLTVVVTGACSSDEDVLTIYSGREEELVGPLLEQFSEDTGIEIEVRYGDSADLALLIEQEGDNTPADIFFSQSPGAVGFLSNEGLLAQLPDDVLSKVDSGFASDDGEWVGITARQRVLAYNSELVDESELPDSVLDLTAPEFEGRVGVAPSNSSFQDFITVMRQVEGDDVAADWLQGMADNESPTYADNSSIIDAVARGEVPMGLVNHYYNYRYLLENPDVPSVNHVFPDGDIGALLLASTVSVLEPSSNDQAIELVEYLQSDESQQYFVDNESEYPLIGDVPAPEGLPTLDELQVPSYDIQALGEGLRETVEMISESGLD